MDMQPVSPATKGVKQATAPEEPAEPMAAAEPAQEEREEATEVAAAPADDSGNDLFMCTWDRNRKSACLKHRASSDQRWSAPTYSTAFEPREVDNTVHARFDVGTFL
eukprot:6033217-Pyramimonas_sp.AAC.1